MKNELMQPWYRAVFMVTENENRHEYSIFVQGSSEIGAAVSAAVGITERCYGISNVTFKSIRIATYGEAEKIEAESADAVDEGADHE